MKWLWLVFGAAIVAGGLVSPGPSTGESAAHYILFSSPTAAETACAVIAAISGSILFMAHMMRERP